MIFEKGKELIKGLVSNEHPPGVIILTQIKNILEDDSILPRHKKQLCSEVEQLYTPDIVASMIKHLVGVPYENAASKAEVLAKLFPHLPVREASTNKGYMIKMALNKLRETGLKIENVWRPANGYRICIPDKRDRLYLIVRRIWPLMNGMQKWENRLKGEDIDSEEIEMFKKEIISSLQ